MTNPTQRLQGAFYTPKPWADEAIRVIAKHFGSDWKGNSLVWDPAAGTGNMVAGHAFNDLILTTLDPADLPALQATQPNALVAQYDFLCPPDPDAIVQLDSTNNLPESIHIKLTEAVKSGTRLVFLMNPPYSAGGTAGRAGYDPEYKGGTGRTQTSMDMGGLGDATRQLYAQFLFRCDQIVKEYGFKDAVIAVFSKPGFVCSEGFEHFRTFWYQNWAYKAGFLIQASHFEDLSSRWGISFTLWQSPGQTERKPLHCDVMDLDSHGKPIFIGTKQLYDSDGRRASDWTTSRRISKETAKVPAFTSGLQVDGTGTLPVDTLAVLMAKGNNVYQSLQWVFMLSGAFAGHGYAQIPLNQENFARGCAYFAARKLVKCGWLNDKDEFLIPDVEHRDWKMFETNAVIYALLHPYNNCVAMRAGNMRVANHFFWRTRQQTMDTFARFNEAVWKDATEEPLVSTEIGIAGTSDVQPWQGTGDRYLAWLLPRLDGLTDKAKTALAILDDVWMTSSLECRGSEFHLGAWDAGVYQLRKKYKGTALWETLRKAFFDLENELRGMVRELKWVM